MELFTCYLKSVDPNQSVTVSKETAHVLPFSLSIPNVDIIDSHWSSHYTWTDGPQINEPGNYH